MKRLYFGLLLILCTNLLNAQNQQNAIGVRSGAGSDGIETEISFQHYLTDINRAEFDLGVIRGNQYQAFNIAGLYHWVWKLDYGFDLFGGGGGRIGTWSDSTPNNAKGSGGFLLAAAGHVGVEYTFPVGVQLGLDYMPQINLINHGDALASSVAISVRYRF